MSVSHRYKNFGKGGNRDAIPESLSQEALEDEKLQSFESGYRAGWDDSTKAQSDARDNISTELATNLQEMSFTYHEALSRLTQSFEPVMKEILVKLLPRLSSAALSGHVLEEISVLIRENAAQTVEISVAPENTEIVEKLSVAANETPFRIIGEPSLGAGQAYVKIGSVEREVDIDSVITGLSEAIDAFFYEVREEAGND